MHIHKFQELMRDLYSHRDNERGEKGTYEWLTDEVEELGDALKADDKKGMEEEFADVLAWLASLANVLDVNLEKAALAKYNKKCPKCGCAPCNCTF
jgi:NTP pyrophosphatase (non-canonical NTP hydrolase)